MAFIVVLYSVLFLADCALLGYALWLALAFRREFKEYVAMVKGEAWEKMNNGF